MLSRTTRRLSDAEVRTVGRAPLFNFRGRVRAKADCAQGTVEVLDFDIGRVWKLISCPGPPCCPNTWLIEAGPDTFVYIQSWQYLKEPGDQRFPGTHVTVERLPLSGRVLSAWATGPIVAIPDTPDEVRHWWTREDQECPILSRSDFRPQLLKAAGLS